MNRQAPPQTAGPRRQLTSRKIIYGSAALAFSFYLSVLLVPAAMGLLVAGVLAVICSQNSREIAEKSLVKSTRLRTAPKL